MSFARTLLLCLALLGCEGRRTQAPDWVQSAPAAAAMAVSFRADWALEQSRLRPLLERFPLAGRALELFLARTRIDLRHETGRLTVYLTHRAPAGHSGFLFQLGGFRDPGKLQVAIADGFPVDPRAPDSRDHPQFVVLDLDTSHIRAMADGEGRVWLGDAADLAGLGPRPAELAAAAWISGNAPIQGFLRPPEFLGDVAVSLPGELARSLPKGIESVAWAVTPGPGADAPNGFELSLAGSAAAVQRASPWLQRFVASVMAAAGPAQIPEILQERHRISLRGPLSQAQVDAAMARLDQPPLPLH